MNEVMTWAEIEAAFDGEWVLIEDPETTPVLQIIRGKVVFHSKSKEQVLAVMKKLPRLQHAFLYIGEPPKDLEYAL